MLIDTMFARRDMYQVYKINDDWLVFLHQNRVDVRKIMCYGNDHNNMMCDAENIY